jgi:hypothetical protein
VVVEKHSSRVIDKYAKTMDKAQARKTKANDQGFSKNPSSVLSNFHSSYFVNVAQKKNLGLQCTKEGRDKQEVMKVLFWNVRGLGGGGEEEEESIEGVG